MPSIWQDVRWNWGTAGEAVSALERAARLLNGTADERAYKARDATAEWRGAHRERFDEELGRLVRQAHDLAQEYRSAASRIRRASDAARSEQRRRERARAIARRSSGK